MMKLRLIALLGVLCLAVLSGCVRAARDTSGFALQTRGTINASYADAWQAVKATLREQGYELYTRDKRGIFIAYTPHKRSVMLQPHRVKFTIELGSVTDSQTDIVIETVNQRYGVTLLTDPDWHDRPATDDTAARAILEGAQARAGGGALLETDASAAAPELTKKDRKAAKKAAKQAAKAEKQAAKASATDSEGITDKQAVKAAKKAEKQEREAARKAEKQQKKEAAAAAKAENAPVAGEGDAAKAQAKAEKQAEKQQKKEAARAAKAQKQAEKAASAQSE